MRFAYVILALFIYSESISQQPVQLPFDKLARKTSVSFAMYIHTEKSFENFDLNQYFRTQFQAGKIKASLPLDRDYPSFNKVKYSTIRNLNYYLSPHEHFEQPTFTPVDGEIPEKRNVDSLYAVASPLNYISEIVYVDNGQLKTYVPWVSPKFPVITSTGVELGTSLYFSTAYNFRYRYTGKKNDAYIDLGRTETEIDLDSNYKQNMLKQQYGMNLLEASWCCLLSSAEFISMISGKKLLTTKVESFRADDNNIYNANGVIISDANDPSQYTPALFPKLKMVQQWKYNTKRNIVTSDISELILYGNYRSAPDEPVALVPVLKIVL